jgi:lipoprotein-anchoring transpeptidase ErfK/SrfK
MRANRAMWMAAALMAGAMIGRADAADTANEAVVRRLVVSIPDRKLAVIENNEVVEVFPVAVGAPNSPSPTGTFTIVNRVANPTYYHPGKVIAPGPQNPIGTRWIGLNQKGYGIHGTDQPSSIGYAKSHGCIRLRNADVERLFERVRTGDVVELHAERTPELDQLFTSIY